MKKIFNKILVTATSVLLLVACNKDLLDKAPLDSLSPDSYFRNQAEVELVLTGIYNMLDWNEIQKLDQFSDDLYDPANARALTFLNGTATEYTSDYSDGVWEKAYKAIGRSNLLIENIDQAEINDEAVRNQYKAEALFVRSLYYFRLVNLFGDVPLILEEPTTSQDKIFVERTGMERVYQQIETDLIEAITSLPDKGFNKNHATKGAAQTLLTKVYLFQEEWTKAAETAKAVIDGGKYKLFSDYGGLFMEENENNSEVIFDIAYVKDVYPNKIPNQMKKSPTVSIVEAYGYIDGSEFNAETDYTNQPFENRDSRLAENVVYPGGTFRGDNQVLIPGTSNEFVVQVTGQMIQKYIDWSNPVLDNNGVNFIVFRYADVLLMYAEAQNEASGVDESVYNAVNQIRQRAGVADLPAGLSQAEMREYIRKERRLELAFEGWRFLDIKRWNIGTPVLDEDITGYNREKLVDPGNPEQWVFEIQFVETRDWSNTAKNKYGYLFPIPGTERDVNSNLSQNTGY